MSSLLNKAWMIAEKESVSTPPGMAVVYSISYMPHSENRTLARAYTAAVEGAMLLDDTPCGKALVTLGLNGRVDEVAAEITAVWKKASSRFIAAASGNIAAFVNGADERSTFCTVELHEIMANPRITHINGIEKSLFAANFHPKRY